MREFESFKRQLAASDRAVLIAELFSKMKRAESGDLKFGRGSRFDVDEMECTTCVLELRLSDMEIDTGDDIHEGALIRRHVRLYFTEPDAIARELTALKFIWKQPGPIGLREQTEWAKAAAWRADDHVARFLGAARGPRDC